MTYDTIPQGNEYYTLKSWWGNWTTHLCIPASLIGLQRIRL